MSTNDPSVRRILPQDSLPAQGPQMSTFSFAPQQYPQRETQKNYVFVDEHNRHKRLKVMRACEGCRRRKIKCDAATTNTWPCSACIRLKLHCVRPNGYDGSADSTTYEGFITPASQFQHIAMSTQASRGQVPIKPESDVYAPQAGYPDTNSASFHTLSYDASQSQHNIHYTTLPPPMSLVDQHVAAQDAFPTPPMQQASHSGSSPGSYSNDSYQQQDLADLLGGLKVNEVGTAPYLRNKASFRREDPAVEDDDDFGSVLPPISAGAGHKVRIPPELMPDDATALHYFDLYFTHVHPYVPVLNRAVFYRQWATARESISPLILEALFAIGGRIADDPAQGQQWLALASRHADSFMDTPRLSTLQALLMILKAREAAPKRGYYYRSWMTVVQCVQMAKDLSLDDHFEDHQSGRPCEYNPTECQLRTRIWQTIFVCEVMVGTPQGRYNLAVDLDSVDFSVQKPIPGGDDAEYHISRNFTYFARNVRSIARISHAYLRLKKRKDWAIDPEFQEFDHTFHSFLTKLPADLSITFPPDGSAPWLPSPFLGNLHAYYYLALILFHRPQLSFLDPTTNEVQWKHHMMVCYSSAKAICRLQEAVVTSFGLTALQCMQRGFSFTVYAGLSCIVLHLVAIVSPDPDLHSEAREYFTRHMRIMEKVMDAWPMPELQKQVDAVREAFSADIRKPFVLKPSFPYGSPHLSNSSSPPGYRRGVGHAGPMNQQLDTSGAQTVSYISHPISPPISAGGLDSKSDSPSAQSLVMMPQASQGPGMPPSMTLAEQPTWNPARIFEQWNTSFGTPTHSETDPVTQANSLNIASSSGAPEASTLEDMQAVDPSLPAVSQHSVPPQQYSAAPVPNFMTPAMWQESVASVYEGGLKRSWDYDGNPVMKRR